MEYNLSTSVWVVEGTDKTAYCDDGAVTTIVGVGLSEESANRLKSAAQSKNLYFDFTIYEVETDIPVPFGEENPYIGDRKRREIEKAEKFFGVTRD